MSKNDSSKTDLEQGVIRPRESTFTGLPPDDGVFRILSLDGGGSKGFYTLGVLREIEAMINCQLCKYFDLIYGTSTGAIIASLIALGFDVEQIYELYKEHVPIIMKAGKRKTKSKALAEIASKIYGKSMFSDVKTGVGIVATKWEIERPMIFKGSVSQAHGRIGSFVPGFGVPLADAVQASCSAFPFFNRKIVTTSQGDEIELIDGGYCANNPTLYAIADAIHAFKKSPGEIRVVSIGVGVYPEPKPSLKTRFIKNLQSVQLLQKTLEINTQSMEQLRLIMFRDIPTIRISDTFEKPEMATDFLEYDLKKLNLLRQCGSDSFAAKETEIKKCIFPA